MALEIQKKQSLFFLFSLAQKNAAHPLASHFPLPEGGRSRLQKRACLLGATTLALTSEQKHEKTRLRVLAFSFQYTYTYQKKKMSRRTTMRHLMASTRSVAVASSSCSVFRGAQRTVFSASSLSSPSTSSHFFSAQEDAPNAARLRAGNRKGNKEG